MQSIHLLFVIIAMLLSMCVSLSAAEVEISSSSFSSIEANEQPSSPSSLPSVQSVQVGPNKLLHTKHGPFLLSLTDTFVSRSLLNYGEWCESEVRLFTSLISPTSLVVDIGANIGAFTIPLLRHVGPLGAVVAFEPQRRLFHLLNANVALNDFPNAFLYNLAVSDGQSGDTISVPRVDYGSAGNFGGISLLPASAWKDRGPVDVVGVTTLDALLPSLSTCPSFVKIDVEGMEQSVLNGGRGMFAKCRPVMHVENNCKMGSREIVTFLRSAAGGRPYVLFWDLHTYYNPLNFFKNPVDIFSDELLSVNVVAVPEEQTERVELLRGRDMIEIDVDGGKWLLEDYVVGFRGENHRIQQLGTLEVCIR